MIEKYVLVTFLAFWDMAAQKKQYLWFSLLYLMGTLLYYGLWGT